MSKKVKIKENNQITGAANAKRPSRLASIPWATLSLVLLFFGAGILLIIFPEKSLTWAVRIIAGAVLLLALLQLILSLGKKTRGFILVIEIISSLAALAGGGLLLYAPDRSFEYLVMCTGVILMIDGSFKLQTAVHSRFFRSVLWWIVFVIAVLVIAGGFLLIRIPVTPENLHKTAIFMGAFFMVEGVQNLLAYFFRIGVSKKMRLTEAEGMKDVPLPTAEQTAITEEASVALPSATDTSVPLVKGAESSAQLIPLPTDTDQ
ncbi:MAG: DUF308 domain-containing protein [Clostridia bacterium]|nr:DUF308 domain-containing protein [Clostridia bacterium]